MSDFDVHPRLRYPARGEVHLWWASLAEFADKHTVFASYLSESERRRIDRLRRSAVRVRRLVSRGLLRASLARYLDADPGMLAFTENPMGKPALVEPVHDLQFNVSHSGNLWVCAVTKGQPVGVDVERVRPLSPHHIMPFLAPEERVAWLETFGSRPKSEGVSALFALWARKEAYVKARGLGLHLPLDAFAVTMDVHRAPKLRYDRHHPDAPTGWVLTDLDHFPGVRGALAISGPLHSIFLRAIRIGSDFAWVDEPNPTRFRIETA